MLNIGSGELAVDLKANRRHKKSPEENLGANI